jgi:predicted nucleic acid-binding Zn ribbon protein
MIKNVEVEENGSIDLIIDNTELLNKRADIDINDTFDKERGGNGGMKGNIETDLESDKKRLKWNEPTRKATDVRHKCPVCGTHYWGRPNKDYCTTRCKEVAKKRRSRKRMRDIRDFSPYRGKAGEVYFKDEKGITFIPAFNGDSRARAKKYLEDTYSDKDITSYYEQIKEVIKK